MDVTLTTTTTTVKTTISDHDLNLDQGCVRYKSIQTSEPFHSVWHKGRVGLSPCDVGAGILRYQCGSWVAALINIHSYPLQVQTKLAKGKDLEVWGNILKT